MPLAVNGMQGAQQLWKTGTRWLKVGAEKLRLPQIISHFENVAQMHEGAKLGGLVFLRLSQVSPAKLWVCPPFSTLNRPGRLHRSMPSPGAIAPASIHICSSPGSSVSAGTVTNDSFKYLCCLPSQAICQAARSIAALCS